MQIDIWFYAELNNDIVDIDDVIHKLMTRYACEIISIKEYHIYYIAYSTDNPKLISVNVLFEKKSLRNMPKELQEEQNK